MSSQNRDEEVATDEKARAALAVAERAAAIRVVTMVPRPAPIDRGSRYFDLIDEGGRVVAQGGEEFLVGMVARWGWELVRRAF